MKNIARIALASAFLLTGVARAQSDSWASYHPNKTLWLVNWEISGPVGQFADYVSNTSLRGFSVEGRSFLRDNLSFGLSFSWNRYYQTYDLLTVPIANGDASGPVYRYADMFGIRALAHYYVMNGPVRPYLGVGIGGVWNYAYQQVTDLYTDQSHFDFIVSPEVGLLYRVAGGATSVDLNVAFRYTFTTANLVKGSDAQWLTIPVLGLAWSY